MSIYGGMGYSGVHDEECEAVSDYEMRERGVNWRDHERWLYEEERKQMIEDNRRHKTLRMSIKLSEP